MHAYFRVMKNRQRRSCDVCGRKTKRIRLCRPCRRLHLKLTTMARILAAFN